MYSKHIRDPVFGYIGLTEVERNIVDTFPVQRLRGIKQLSVSNIAYPSADHSRFSHVLGTMHLAGEIAESLDSGVDISEEDWQMIRLGGLLHDVGHGPFSHSYEEILSRHRDMTHEDMGAKILVDSSLADVISEQGFDPGEISELVFGEPKGEKYFKQIITGQFDADKMDFLLRDSYFTGVEYGQIDVNRLIQAMEIIDNNIAIDKKALAAIETFMIARYEMFLTVYYHHAVRAAEIMLRTAMEHAHEILELTDFESPEEFLQLDDAYVTSELKRLDPLDYKGKDKEEAKKAKELYQKISRRELLKSAFERTIFLKDEYVAKLLSDESVRKQKEIEIAGKAGIEPELVTVDVPTLTSMPYYPREIDPVEVPVFENSMDGKKKMVPLSGHSRLVNVLKGYVDIVRVYTTQKYRDPVGRASEKVFEELPLSAKVSM